MIKRRRQGRVDFSCRGPGQGYQPATSHLAVYLEDLERAKTRDMKRPASSQKQILGPSRFPVAASEGDRLCKGSLDSGEWWLSSRLRHPRCGDIVIFLAACSRMTSRVRTSLLGLRDPQDVLEMANQKPLTCPLSAHCEVRHSDGTLDDA